MQKELRLCAHRVIEEATPSRVSDDYCLKCGMLLSVQSALIVGHFGWREFGGCWIGEPVAQTFLRLGTTRSDSWRVQQQTAA